MRTFKHMSISRAALLTLGLTSAATAAPISSKPLAVPQTEEPGPSIVDTLFNSTLVGRGPNDTHNGWATYYNAQENRGACGWMNKNNEHVVAIGKSLWDSTQGRNGASSLCGKTATVQWYGKSVNVRVVDECPVCGYNDIDLSPSAFEQLGNKDIGRLEGIKWKFD